METNAPSRAIQAELLQQRIIENAASQEVDLVKWIFERMSVGEESQVLELCCGTGGQTVEFLRHLDASGSIVALDISQAALDVLASKVASAERKKMTLVNGSLENFGLALRKSISEPPQFDLVFCSYGLYYSTDTHATLNGAKAWLRPGGRIVVVGPFGPNNKPLFDMVRASGVTISEAVTASSERFMLETVLPWAAVQFEAVSVHTMVNRVRWPAPERVMNYWQNTTFYDESRRQAFEGRLRAHFEQHSDFVNEKWVMMVEMKHARS